MPKALLLCDEVCFLEPEAARRISDRLIEKAPEMTTGQLRARLRRLVIAADPLAAANRAKAQVKGRRVVISQDHDNLASICAYDLLPHRVAAGYERLTAIARAAKAAGDPRRIDELRADVMLDLLVGEGIATGGPVTNDGLEELPDDDGDAGETGKDSSSISVADAFTANASSSRIVVCEPDERTPWPQAPADPDLLDPAADPPVATSHTDDATGTEPPEVAAEASAESEGDPAVDPGYEELRPYWLAGFDQLAMARPNSCPHCGQYTGQDSPQDASHRGPMPAPRRGVIDLHMSLTTLMGLDDLPAELSGFGPLLADIARQVVEQRPDLQLRFSVYNEIDALLAHGTTKVKPVTGPPGRRTQRRPTAELAALVRARNRTCAAPGCRVPSLRCELDHIIAWADDGETEANNLDPACTRHHRFKHSPGSELVAFNPSTFGWQTPLGMQYLSRPDPPIYDDHRYICQP